MAPGTQEAVRRVGLEPSGLAVAPAALAHSALAAAVAAAISVVALAAATTPDTGQGRAEGDLRSQRRSQPASHIHKGGIVEMA